MDLVFDEITKTSVEGEYLLLMIRQINAKILRIAPFAISLLFFVLAEQLDFGVETIGPTGLREVIVPYATISFVLYLSSCTSLFLGVMINLVAHRRRKFCMLRAFAGSFFLALGLTVILLAALMLWFAEDEYAERCIAIHCLPFIQGYFQMVTEVLVIASAGGISIAIGLWLIVRSGSQWKPKLL